MVVRGSLCKQPAAASCLRAPLPRPFGPHVAGYKYKTTNIWREVSRRAILETEFQAYAHLNHTRVDKFECICSCIHVGKSSRKV